MKLHYGDLTDTSCLVKIIAEIKPDEVYNLAAQSHVKVSVYMCVCVCVCVCVCICLCVCTCMHIAGHQRFSHSNNINILFTHNWISSYSFGCYIAFEAWLTKFSEFNYLTSSCIVPHCGE